MTSSKPALGGGKSSLDSNVFIYAFLGQDARKRAIALDLVNAAQVQRHTVALQVMGEVFNRLRRPDGIATPLAAKLVTQEFAHFELQPATPGVFASAMQLAARTGRQFWDSLIIATCAEHGVKTLYTEDQGSEPQTVLGVRLINPFADLKKP
jgi:predicted nucleic acid-binding protein